MRDTQQIRNVIRKLRMNTYGFIVTNKYKHCRTVKIYRGQIATPRELMTAVAALNINASMTVNNRAIIIRVPITY